MTNEEKILRAILGLSGRGICDDCLAELAGVHPRQTVNQVVRRLIIKGQVTRRLADCNMRQVGVDHGRKEKLLSYLADLETRPCKLAAPTLEEQTDKLSQWLFEAGQFLNKQENLTSNKEPFAARVARLVREGKMEKTLSAQMQLLNTYRVQVVKDRAGLDFEDWSIADAAMNKTRGDWNRLQHRH